MESVVHHVKSWPMFFKYILDGTRTSDIRLNDRGYRVGDRMVLNEWNPVTGDYTGRFTTVEITFMQENKSNPCAISEEAIAPGYCVLSIKLVDY